MYMYEGVGMLKRVIYGMVHHREALRYDDVLGIMVISRSLTTVHHHAIYDPFEHTHAFIYTHTGSG